MAIFGLGTDDKMKVGSKTASKAKAKPSKSSQADDARAMLAATEQKAKDKPDDCVFC